MKPKNGARSGERRKKNKKKSESEKREERREKETVKWELRIYSVSALTKRALQGNHPRLLN